MKVKEAIETLQKATANCQEGDRHIVVIDRGWIFAGDLSQDKATGVFTLFNAVNVRKWQNGGFGMLTQSASKAGATLDPCEPIKFNSSAVVFTVPISAGWDDGC